MARGRVPARGAASAPPVLVFDREAKRLQRDRAALLSSPRPGDAADGLRPHEHLRDEIAWQVADRVHDIARVFGRGLDLGCGRGHLGRHLDTVRGRGGAWGRFDRGRGCGAQDTVKALVQCDLSAGLLAAMEPTARDLALRVQCDEEALPFATESFDMVASALRCAVRQG